jgi:UPF0042 nucleotide-binding protein
MEVLAAPTPAPSPVIVLSGPSGSGLGTATHMLEDIGYRVLQALPPELLKAAVRQLSGDETLLAAVIDLRSGNDPLGAYAAVREAAGERGVRLVLLSTAPKTLVLRYNETRRPHPLSGHASLAGAIEAETALLEPLFANPAAEIVPTDHLTPAALGAEIRHRLSLGRAPVEVVLLSFSYRDGCPPEADLVFDTRSLPNPHWVPGLRGLDGRDPVVAKYALTSTPEARGYTRTLERALLGLLPALRGADRTRLVVAFGCTGGRHRSVAMAEHFAIVLERAGVGPLRLEHRQLGVATVPAE